MCSCCMPCVHYGSMQVLSLGPMLSTGVYTPCMSIYTATESDMYTMGEVTHSSQYKPHVSVVSPILWHKVSWL